MIAGPMILSPTDLQQSAGKGCGMALRAPWGQMQGSATTSMPLHRRGVMRCFEGRSTRPREQRVVHGSFATGVRIGSGSKDSPPPFAKRRPAAESPGHDARIHFSAAC